VWSKNGRELFYVAPGASPDVSRVMAVDVSTASTFRASMPHLLFASREAGSFVLTHPVRNYDVSPDGRRFLTSVMEGPPPDPPAPHIDVVLNWFDELRARAKRGQ
jgi:hypothetical protein